MTWCFVNGICARIQCSVVMFLLPVPLCTLSTWIVVKFYSLHLQCYPLTLHRFCKLRSLFLCPICFSVFGVCTNRDEWEKHPVCNGPSHTGALQCDEHSRLRSHHLALFISLLLAALRDRGPYTWGAPPITLHPGQNLRGQQQRPDAQRRSC